MPTIDLSPRDVHVWVIDTTTVSRESRDPLSSDERDRAGRFHFEKDRTAFVAARNALRQILCRYLADATPQAIRFRYSTNGKPDLAPPWNVVQFNLSHSGAIGLCAVTHLPEIGIDVEFMKPSFPALKVAQRFFTPEEVEWLRSQQRPDQLRRFYQLWTAKEAVMKACGQGMQLEPSHIHVQLPTGETTAHVDQNSTGKGTWSLEEVELAGDYQGTLATRDKPARITKLQFPTDS